MKNKTIEYRLSDKTNKLNQIIGTEIKKKTFDKEFNLSGEYSSKGGIEIYNHFSFIAFNPNIGPLVKLNLSIVSTNQNGKESKLILKRINGETFNLQFWFIIFFITLTLIIAIYQIINYGFNDKMEFLIMPIFGFVYYLTMEIIAEISIQNLIKRIEKIMIAEKIEFNKL